MEEKRLEEMSVETEREAEEAWRVAEVAQMGRTIDVDELGEIAFMDSTFYLSYHWERVQALDNPNYIFFYFFHFLFHLGYRHIGDLGDLTSFLIYVR